MGIPEHHKCVLMWKRIRERRHQQAWVKFRKWKRKIGEMGKRERIRNRLKAEMTATGRNRHWISMRGRYGKYDD